VAPRPAPAGGDASPPPPGGDASPAPPGGDASPAPARIEGPPPGGAGSGATPGPAEPAEGGARRPERRPSRRDGRRDRAGRDRPRARREGGVRTNAAGIMISPVTGRVDGVDAVLTLTLYGLLCAICVLAGKVAGRAAALGLGGA